MLPQSIPTPSSSHPLPVSSSPITACPQWSEGATALGLASAPGHRTAFQPPCTVKSWQRSSFFHYPVLVTAVFQRQSQVTPCHSMLPSLWHWQLAQGAASLCPTASFLPFAAQRHAGGIWTYITLLASDALGHVTAGSSNSLVLELKVVLWS